MIMIGKSVLGWLFDAELYDINSLLLYCGEEMCRAVLDNWSHHEVSTVLCLMCLEGRAGVRVLCCRYGVVRQC